MKLKAQPNTKRTERIRVASTLRRERNREQTQKTILDAAVKLFLKHGYEGFSLRQVAENTGYTPTTIYLYFKDKDDLLLHVAFDGFREFGRALQNAFEREDKPLERLRLVGRAYMDFGLSHPVHYRLMFMERSDLTRIAPPKDHVPVMDSFQVLLDAINACLDANTIRPADPMFYAALVWSHVHGFVSLHLATQAWNKEQALEMFEHGFEVIQKGFVVPKKRGRTLKT